LRADLIEAIALELAQMGYRPCAEPGHLQREDGEPLKRVADDIWRRVKEIRLEREYPP
jgi:hypothetical protein